MQTQPKAYEQALELLEELSKMTDEEIVKRPEIHHALAILEEQSGYIKLDSRLAKLCADCFMLGVYIARQENGITLEDEAKALRCLRCQYVEFKNGTFKCRLAKCKFD